MLKRTLFSILAAFATFAATTAFADVSITFNVGILTNSDGTTPMADGKLLQVIAAGNDGNFSTPTAGSFFSGDDALLVSWAMDSNISTGTPGVSSFSYQFNISGYFANEKLIFRWWPTLNSNAGSPGAGTAYGDFRTDATPDGSTDPWKITGDGSQETLNFFTQSYTSSPSSQPNSAGVASKTVAAVPEPSSMLLAGLGFAGFAAMRRFRRK